MDNKMLQNFEAWVGSTGVFLHSKDGNISPEELAVEQARLTEVYRKMFAAKDAEQGQSE